MSTSAHRDTFVRDHLPPRELWPDLIFPIPQVQYPDQLNCVSELLDSWIQRGRGDAPAILGEKSTLTYRQLQEQVDRVAHVLTDEMGLVPGNRVLLHGPNNPTMATCWLAAAKAGLVVVATMPLLREKELVEVIEKAQIGAALCDKRLSEPLLAAQQRCPVLRQIVYFNDPSDAGLEARMAAWSEPFQTIATAADDPVLIAFTSGSTGQPKATIHFHRDMLAISDCFSEPVVQLGPDDISIGTPPLAFTYGLGALLIFPLHAGGATVLLEKLTPESMLHAINEYHATTTWSTPLFYRQMAAVAGSFELPTLRKGVSAGEALPVSTRTQWRDATGIEIIDGIGSTEMLHIFIAAAGADVRPGATGKPVPGYEACIVDEQGNPLPAGIVGKLAVKGPTGCRYLDDERQRTYVQNGWNLTGDAYLMDSDGYFWFQARTDDIILSAGYNIAGPEVEGVLLMHPAVAECAVVGAPDAARGTIVKAFVVLKPGYTGDDTLARELQEFVKQSIAPYKYPRAVEFCETLPRSGTGKIQRYRLRQQERDKARI
ncbi:MAG: AMP-binding protein [Ktedonobacteraceae bacterium]|nr:AMP-binding protein [Ktedonobacteraceae bacterium]